MLKEILINYIASVAAGITLGGGYIFYKKKSFKQENKNGNNSVNNIGQYKQININLTTENSEPIIKDITNNK